MLHSLVVLVDLIGLFILKTFLLANITITHDVPATMRAGEEVKVTVNVEKGNLGGFAKLQFDLPPGLSIQAIDAKGASFTFADGKAKFIWMALPSQPNFKVTYNLIADASATGNLNIQGRLSYIENNERRTYDMPASAVRIEGGAPMVAKAAEPTPLADPGPELVTAAGGAPVFTPSEPEVDAASAQQGRVTVNRSITATAENEFLVEVSIEKGDLRGFGKLQETIPQGFTALEKNSEDAIFTAQDRIIKFVWLNLPARSEMRVVYKLRSNGQPEGQYTVSGEFGYLVNDETQRALVPATTFAVGGSVATTEDPKRTETTTPVEEPPVKETPRDVAVQTPTPQPKPKETPKPDETAQRTTPRVPAPETGITYRVQISAGHREVSRNYFVQRHRFNGEFNTERHQGWIKFTTGRFSSYRDARDQRVGFVSAGHNFPGPFVTAYNDGVRITVQEALMISNQKWVQ